MTVWWSIRTTASFLMCLAIKYNVIWGHFIHKFLVIWMLYITKSCNIPLAAALLPWKQWCLCHSSSPLIDEPPRGRSCQVRPVKQQVSLLTSQNISRFCRFCFVVISFAVRCSGFSKYFPSFWSQVVFLRWDYDTLWDKQLVTQPFCHARWPCSICWLGFTLEAASMPVSQSCVWLAISQSHIRVGGQRWGQDLRPFHMDLVWWTNSQSACVWH